MCEDGYGVGVTTGDKGSVPLLQESYYSLDICKGQKKNGEGQEGHEIIRAEALIIGKKGGQRY